MDGVPYVQCYFTSKKLSGDVIITIMLVPDGCNCPRLAPEGRHRLHVQAPAAGCCRCQAGLGGRECCTDLLQHALQLRPQQGRQCRRQRPARVHDLHLGFRVSSEHDHFQVSTHLL